MRGGVRIAAWLLVGAFSSAPLEAQLGSRLHAGGFDSPLAIVQDPVERALQFVVEQGGRIRAVRDGSVLPGDFLDLSSQVLAGGERGLLGLAFIPGASGTRFLVNFTDRGGDTVVARFRRQAGAVVADLPSRFDLRWGGTSTAIRQPFSNHNGGHLAFGPDGYLYVGLGDGGSSNDPDHRAQNGAELLGKMLRIDVDVPDGHPTGYEIPPDNPFTAGRGPVPARPEIWAFGLRNPWRYTFDAPALGGTGAMLIGDVGQNRLEEIDYEPAGRGGRNYGWRNREGAGDNRATPPPAYLPLVDPIFEYGRASGRSITGGYVYRGRALPAGYHGRYFFADFVSGRVWSLGLAVNAATGEASASDLLEHTAELGDLGNISSFGIDADGELFIVSHSHGSVYRIVGPADTPPAPSGLRIIR